MDLHNLDKTMILNTGRRFKSSSLTFVKNYFLVKTQNSKTSVLTNHIVYVKLTKKEEGSFTFITIFILFLIFLSDCISWYNVIQFEETQVMFVFVSDWCYKSRYTCSWITLSYIDFVVVSQALCNEWVNSIVIFYVENNEIPLSLRICLRP